jgi:hypothetical protein
MNPEENIGYLCDECATELGWRWPKDHCATYHKSKCGVCKEEKMLSCWSDWLRPSETEIAAENWD